MALEANVEAGNTSRSSALTCTDPGGDTVYIEPTQLPSHGTMHPARPAAGHDRAHLHRGDGDAGGLTDTIRFRAVGGRRSNQITIEIPISAGHVPVCPSHLALQVYAGQGIVFAQNPCTDDDCDPLTIVAVDTPAHGAITMAPTPPWTYMPAEGFVGDDVLTYRARDARTESNLAVLGLYVVPWPYLGRPVAVTPPAPDLVPPTLSLAVQRGAAAMPRALPGA